jgi:hypothetical protein
LGDGWHNSAHEWVEVKVPRSTSVALGSIFVLVSLTSCTGSGLFSDDPAPFKDLRAAAGRFTSALTKQDRAALEKMNGSGFRDDRLAVILGNFGGLKSEVVEYSRVDLPTHYVVDFRAKCVSRKVVHFSLPFVSIDGSWHPVFGDLKSKPAETIPEATAPPAVVGPPLTEESC